MAKASDHKRASATISDALADVRAHIAETTAERTKIATLEVSEDVALERLSAWCATLQAKGASKVSAARFLASHYRDPAPADGLDIALGALAPQIQTALTKEIRAAGKGGLPHDQRAARLVELEAELLASELSEESIIRSAEKAGMQILRRADADPRAVLAADEALP